MTHEKLKDGASHHSNQAASISTNVDTLSMNNINISNSEDIVLKSTECGKEADITSNKKVSTSCAQNLVDSNNDIVKREQHTSRSAVSDIVFDDSIDKNLIPDDDLFKDPPPHEECPICILPMPFSFLDDLGVGKTYMACCGKFICCACMIAARDEMKEGNIKQWCALCRVPYPRSKKELVQRYKQRMKQNDGEAFYALGCAYRDGEYSLPKDEKKTSELLIKAAELGSTDAHHTMGRVYYHGKGGVEKDIEKAIHYWKLAAIGGHEVARCSLGMIEMSNDNFYRAMKHWMIAARSGYDKSLKLVGEGYKAGHVTKDEYASTLRAHKDAQDEMKSEQRDEAKRKIRSLKNSRKCSL
jgi:hypothetical protein